ncbi:NAD+ synthetase [Cellulomonas flavigena DSM 20109]|uniref:Glutamine-dependent NAD(+) synthetase n=1 Tax=Cellulomonas flavigena (strain ATCC 482 / DSM 20109 / BCRC 11376 / JCM 18109 / NBRC 3775 / NCIMB 8073 / NRS 134) TaxID=446466 RepID=D5UK84_CELFN|nr:NAD+ synthase [Cellulomonas flavigena]ADG75745.1 NAD+ synthetase [Cellulomonas flavigena DSM 20109]
MTTLRVALAQLPVRVGDMAGNATALTHAVATAGSWQADVVLTPEMGVCGYPVEDLLAEPEFVRAAMAATQQVARSTDRTVALLGAPWVTGSLPGAAGARPAGSATDTRERGLRNVAVVAQGGQVHGAHAKTLLPTYSVFDDARHVEAGPAQQDLYRVLTPEGPVTFGVLVCEDVWSDALVQEVRRGGAQAVVVLNASPYHVGKQRLREAAVAAAARSAGVPIAYVNAVGGQDELVFDGGSFAVDGDGVVVARGRSFATDLVTVDLPVAAEVDPSWDVVDLGVTHTERCPLPPPPLTAPREVHDEVYTALVTGFRDYCTRVGLPQVVLGLSGGIDSALAATIAVDALGPDAVWGVGMPGPYSSGGSVDDARALADNLGIRFDVVPITDAYLERHRVLAGLLTDRTGATGQPVAWENLQARLRGTTLMTLANATGALVCTTGNRSESAVGYFTLYGDSCGTAPNPLGDLLKTTVTLRDGTVLPGVYGLAQWRNDRAAAAGQAPPIPAATLTKPASAELAPGQQDSDSLPPYPVLDRLLLAFLEDHASARELAGSLVADGWDPQAAAGTVDRVLTLVDRSEFKRRQVPIRIKVSRLAFGRDRRMPLANHWSHATAAVSVEPPMA